ncbi:MAG: acyl-CoA dehydrogenase C-terminal domain-containing protein, partial [Proteobacteria bacterium]|nr:acyl-CoA dehydrogenase C-terminal domain-containing protein [Pseudomonadota bacterium]
GAVPYMHLMGVVVLGLMWLRMARAAQAQLDAGEGDKAFLEAKLVTARFYFDRIAPHALGLRKELEGGSDAMMALPPEAFVRVA